MAVCGAKFFGMVNRFANGPTIADPYNPGVAEGVGAGFGIDSRIVTYGKWIDANRKMLAETHAMQVKLGELAAGGAGAIIDAEEDDEYNALEAFTKADKSPTDPTVGGFTSFDAAIMAEHAAAKRWACLLERWNDTHKDVTGIEALGEQPAADEEPGFFGGLSDVGTGLGVLALVILLLAASRR